MKRLPALTFCLAAVCCFGQLQTNSIRLGWSYTNAPDSYTNYIFLVRGTNSVTAPLPWPVLTNAFGVCTQWVSFAQCPGDTWYFYVTVIRTATETNCYNESPPSNTAWVKWLPPAGPLSISH